MSTEPLNLNGRDLPPVLVANPLPSRTSEPKSVEPRYSQEMVGIHPAIVAKKSYTDNRIAFVLEMMTSSSHLSSRVHTLASMLGLSPSRLRHLFKDQMGISFHRYEVILRLEKVRLRLRTTGCDVKDAARMEGFSDLSNFTNTFKKVYGVTPGRLKVLRSRRSGKS